MGELVERFIGKKTGNFFTEYVSYKLKLIQFVLQVQEIVPVTVPVLLQ